MSSTKPPTLLDDIHRIMRLKHYSIHTERTYCDWIKQFVKFHCISEKQQLFIDSETKIEAFLTYLATDRNVAAATQNQAMNALVFLYKQVLENRWKSGLMRFVQAKTGIFRRCCRWTR